MVHDLKLFGSDWQPQRAKRLPCTQCSKTFATQDDLWQHEINKHSTIDPADLPAAPDNAHLQEAGVPSDAAAHADSGLDALTSRPIVAGNAGASDHDYDYVPCDVCGQAVVRRGWGMLLHLESLKPVIGLDMRCPRCPKTFIEQRALYQHYKFCRLHSADKPASAVGAAVDAAAVE
ncbi:hypothetical protein BC831DRAFT_435517 [Entophlyctis helioformis]|nr:hypothetical protein BC831DRAFT_435517 [Entophlyctis helioformis]